MYYNSKRCIHSWVRNNLNRAYKTIKGSTENNNNVISPKTQTKQALKETCLNRLMSSYRKIPSFSKALYNETK